MARWVLIPSGGCCDVCLGEASARHLRCIERQFLCDSCTVDAARLAMAAGTVGARRAPRD